MWSSYFAYYATGILLVPAILFTLYAQMKVKSNFNRYSRIRNDRNLTGAQAARKVLDANGLTNVRIEAVRGSLTDHYDPRTRVLRLSQPVCNVNSIAAVSVACHEAGHAIQHAEGYAPLKIRNSIVPLANFASNFSWILVIIGVALLASNNYMGDLLFNIGGSFFSVYSFFTDAYHIEVRSEYNKNLFHSVTFFQRNMKIKQKADRMLCPPV